VGAKAPHFLIPQMNANERIVQIFFGLLVIGLAVYLRWASIAVAPYTTGDWLINYSGGFVRRGLTGELARVIWHLTSIKPQAIVFIFQLSIYCIFFLYAYRLVKPALANPGFFLLVFSPLTFAFSVLDPFGAGRKEILYFATFAIHAELGRQQWTP
jgi:hypothetical protein